VTRWRADGIEGLLLAGFAARQFYPRQGEGRSAPAETIAGPDGALEGVLGRRAEHGQVAHLAAFENLSLVVEMEMDARIVERFGDAGKGRLTALASPQDVDHRGGAVGRWITQGQPADRANVLLELARCGALDRPVAAVMDARGKLVDDQRAVREQEHLDGQRPDDIKRLGEVKREYAELLRRADAIFIEELRTHDLYDKVSQAFAVFLPVRSVGVLGDGRRYDYVIALRAVETIDFMTARWARLPYEFLDRVAHRVINEVPGISRVVYDISGKPPATIEWE